MFYQNTVNNKFKKNKIIKELNNLNAKQKKNI